MLQPIVKSLAVMLGAVLISPLVLAYADTYRCDANTFTNVPQAHEGCAPLRSSVTCSPDSGNKYYAPSHPGVTPRVEQCEPTGRSTSPFLRKGDTYAATSRTQSPRPAARSNKDSDKIAISTGTLPSPSDASKMLECAVNAMFDGADATKCK